MRPHFLPVRFDFGHVLALHFLHQPPSVLLLADASGHVSPLAAFALPAAYQGYGFAVLAVIAFHAPPQHSLAALVSACQKAC